ncbi:MAG TPA: aldose 1-epimerase [Candidatus Binataceae bacterium]
MATHPRSPDLLKDPTAHTIRAGELEAVFLPARGMLGASVRHRGVEILGRVEDLEAAAARGSTAGIPFLHPWANRLAEPRYRVQGRSVELDVSSPLLHLDDHGLPMHGVPWSLLSWTVTEASQDSVSARLEWSSSDLLKIFPFRHHVELTASIQSDGLTLTTTLVAASESSVPVSFGFHPYLRIPDLSRTNWLLELPAMRKLLLDSRGIPTGDEEPFRGFSERLDDRSFDDGFTLIDERTSFTIAGATRKITVDLLEGYNYTQIFAPKDKDYIAIEPMTAPTSALTSGRGLRLVGPGEQFRAIFRIRIDAAQ